MRYFSHKYEFYVVISFQALLFHRIAVVLQTVYALGKRFYERLIPQIRIFRFHWAFITTSKIRIKRTYLMCLRNLT